VSKRQVPVLSALAGIFFIVGATLTIDTISGTKAATTTAAAAPSDGAPAANPSSATTGKTTTAASASAASDGGMVLRFLGPILLAVSLACIAAAVRIYFKTRREAPRFPGRADEEAFWGTAITVDDADSVELQQRLMAPGATSVAIEMNTLRIPTEAAQHRISPSVLMRHRDQGILPPPNSPVHTPVAGPPQPPSAMAIPLVQRGAKSVPPSNTLARSDSLPRLPTLPPGGVLTVAAASRRRDGGTVTAFRQIQVIDGGVTETPPFAVSVAVAPPPPGYLKAPHTTPATGALDDDDDSIANLSGHGGSSSHASAPRPHSWDANAPRGAAAIFPSAPGPYCALCEKPCEDSAAATCEHCAVASNVVNDAAVPRGWRRRKSARHTTFDENPTYCLRTPSPPTAVTAAAAAAVAQGGSGVIIGLPPLCALRRKPNGGADKPNEDADSAASDGERTTTSSPASGEMSPSLTFGSTSQCGAASVESESVYRRRFGPAHSRIASTVGSRSGLPSRTGSEIDLSATDASPSSARNDDDVLARELGRASLTATPHKPLMLLAPPVSGPSTIPECVVNLHWGQRHRAASFHAYQRELALAAFTAGCNANEGMLISPRTFALL
jgi:hypothetical protein